MLHFLVAFLGGPANTTYGENISVFGMTRVASTYVVALAAIVGVLLNLCILEENHE